MSCCFRLGFEGDGFRFRFGGQPYCLGFRLCLQFDGFGQTARRFNFLIGFHRYPPQIIGSSQGFLFGCLFGFDGIVE